MAATGETKSKSIDVAAHLGGDLSRIEMLEEIANLSKIPEIEDYFSQALLEAKEKFQDKIKECHRLKGNLKTESSKDKPEEMKEEGIPEISKAFEKGKTYFFELTRVEDPGSETRFRWELGRFKLKNKAHVKIMDIIFDDFINHLDQYEVTSHRIQDEIVDVPSLGKRFHICFTKSSLTRMVGFVKEAEEVQERVIEEREKK